MKVYCKFKNGISVEVEGGNQKEIFEELSTLQEVFGVSACGKCKKTDLKFVVREVDDNKFYEVHCNDCNAKLAYGSHKKGGTLFPKRKDEEGKYLPSQGWVRWNPETKKVE